MATTTTTGAPSKGNASLRRGSNFSDRQIAQSVKDGRAVEVVLPSTSEEGGGWERVVGWVYGVDDYHWGVVTAYGDEYLVHKTVPFLRVTDMVLDQQADWVRKHVEPLVSPFRAYVMRTHFNQQPASN